MAGYARLGRVLAVPLLVIDSPEVPLVVVSPSDVSTEILCVVLVIFCSSVFSTSDDEC